MTALLASFLAALVSGVVASYWTIGRKGEVPANGYATVCFGIHVFELPHPIALRSLFPVLLGPKRWRIEQVIIDRESQRCRNYQMARILTAWFAYLILCEANGLAVMATVAALFTLTLRFDYWSNFVELLGASIVFSVHQLGIPLWNQVLLGVVLGLGRETLPLLALVPGGVPFATGAALTQAAVRLLRREHKGNPKFKDAIEYGECRLDDLAFLLVHEPWETVPRVALYVGILALAWMSAPWLAAALGILTLAGSRIDEPRVLTALLPWAAATLGG